MYTTSAGDACCTHHIVCFYMAFNVGHLGVKGLGEMIQDPECEGAPGRVTHLCTTVGSRGLMANWKKIRSQTNSSGELQNSVSPLLTVSP